MQDSEWESLLPSIDDEVAKILADANQGVDEYEIDDTDQVKTTRPKRKRHDEFNGTGEWTDVRRFDRMPITTDSAAEVEDIAGVPAGTYFVSLARKRLQGIINLHNRWLNKIKNKKSSYASVQIDLRDFYVEMLRQFDVKYASFINHPLFDLVGVTRKRGPNNTISSL